MRGRHLQKVKCEQALSSAPGSIRGVAGTADTRGRPVTCPVSTGRGTRRVQLVREGRGGRGEWGGGPFPTVRGTRKGGRREEAGGGRAPAGPPSTGTRARLRHCPWSRPRRQSLRTKVARRQRGRPAAPRARRRVACGAASMLHLGRTRTGRQRFAAAAHTRGRPVTCPVSTGRGTRRVQAVRDAAPGVARSDPSVQRAQAADGAPTCRARGKGD